VQDWLQTSAAEPSVSVASGARTGRHRREMQHTAALQQQYTGTRRTGHASPPCRRPAQPSHAGPFAPAAQMYSEALQGPPVAPHQDRRPPTRDSLASPPWYCNPFSI
jgi:hypothetical protein